MITGNLRRARARVVSLHQRWHAPQQSLSSNHSTLLLLYNQKNENQHYYYERRCLSSMDGGGADEDDDEDWLPPDHSPLVTSRSSAKKQQPSLAHDNFDSPHQTGDKIEVIDLEATFANQSNQQLLQDDEGDELESKIASSAPEFDVRSSNVGWKELLQELKAEGETEMMDGLVKQYNLQSYVDALESDDDENGESSDMTISNNNNSTEYNDAENEEDEWDEELEESLQGLSQEELIDELIENSPSLSQLEMEILSDELEKSEQGEKNGLDYDTLEDLDFDDNASYRDFRAMVLEDYQEKKNARAKRMLGTRVEGGGSNLLRAEVGHDSTAYEQQSAYATTTTNFSTAADLSAYPPDWKDYDSKAAFQRDFSEDNDSWMPPSSSELIPSRSLRIDEKQGKDGQKSSKKDAAPSTDDLDSTIDWLQARRTRLGDDVSSDDRNQTPTHMLSPEQAEKFSHQNSQIPVVKHTLFTTTELTNSLSAQGGTDIHIIDTAKFDTDTQGVGPGCSFIMLVTGRGASHIRVLADSIVRNLKARKLSERGVMGAMQGAEGGQDIFSNKRSRNRARRNGAVNTSGKVDDDWMVVDCGNVHVHLMEETTRKCLNIEGLWDLSNPNSEGSKLRRVDFTDDEDVDTYVSENPIPDDYAAKIFNDGGGGSGGWISGGAGSRVLTVQPFQKKSFSEKWSGSEGKSKGRRQRRNR